jgi:hypothetical protein
MRSNFWTCFAIGIFSGLCIFGVNSVSAEQKAAVVNSAADFSSGAHSVITVNPVGGPRTSQNDLLPTLSDLTVSAYGKYFYRLGRFMMDNVAKFDIANPTTAVWQYSTLDDGDSVSSNPFGIVFASEQKAYLLRYGKTKAWIINPSTTSEKTFKIGELDLTGYADADGIPEMAGGVIVDGKLFIIIQRMNRDDSWAPGTAYVSVFDVSTDTEIDTGLSGSQLLKGIELPMANPNVIQYLAETGMIYIGCQGRLENTWAGTPAEFTGGILQMNPQNYNIDVLVDDGDDTNHPYGNISKMAVVSKNKGYFVGYMGWGDNEIYDFNPSTGSVSGSVLPSLANKNLTDLKVDENGYLWVGNASDHGISIVDPSDDSIDESVSTNLDPQAIAFTNEMTYAYYLPYMVSGNDWDTGLAVRNLSKTDSATVSVIGINSSGTTIYSNPLFISPEGQANFAVGEGLDLEGWLRIDSTQPLGGLSFIFTYCSEPIMADMPFIKDLSKSLLIPHLAQTGASWDTTVYVCNPNGSAATVTLRFVSQDGNTEVSKNYSISANGSLSVSLDDLVGSNDVKSGSVEISSDQAIGAFALYENLKSENGCYFSGINTTDITP